MGMESSENEEGTQENRMTGRILRHGTCVAWKCCVLVCYTGLNILKSDTVRSARRGQPVVF